MLPRDRTYKNILVVGAGPIGDCFVYKLKQLGLNPIQIEERQLRTRPGILNSDIFDKISKYLKKEVRPSGELSLSKTGIKDLENALEKILVEEEKITRITGRFTNLTKNGAEVRLSSGEIKTIPCDLIIDATGSKRSVLSTVNQIYEKKKENPPFQFSDVGKNPVKKHFIAYVGMEQKYIDELVKNQVTVADTLSTSPKFENLLPLVEICKLRRQFGWEHFGKPQVVVKPIKPNKVCLYVEMPEELKTEDHENWVKAVLKLIIHEDVPFAHLKVSERYKLHPKPRFNIIDMQPKETTPYYFESDDYPTILPIGDALIDPDYRFGIGIREGINRIRALLRCMKIRDGMIEIKFDSYHKTVKAIIAQQKDKLSNRYTQRSQNLEINCNRWIIEYPYIKSISDRNVIFQEMMTSSFPGREKLVRDSCSKIHQAITIAGIFFIDNENHHTSQNFQIAKKYYEFALEIYLNLIKFDKNFKDDYKEYLTLCSNVIIVSKELNDIDSILKYADIALDRVKLSNIMPDAENVFVKIIYDKMWALLYKAENLKEKDQLSRVFTEVDSLMKQLNKYEALVKEMKLPLEEILPRYDALVDRIKPSSQGSLKRRRE